MRIVRPSLASAVLGLLLATTLPAVAATFTVDSTVDAVDATPGDGVCATSTGSCTLRAAVVEANALAGPDVVSLPAGTFRLTPTGNGEDLGLTGDLDVLQTLWIAGAGNDSTIIDGFGADRIIDVLGPNDLAVSDLTLKRGSAGGGEGGAIRHAGPGALTVTNVRFERNLANVGAAIQHADGPLAITGCDFNANVAGYPGAAVNKTGTGALTIGTSRFSANSSDGSGGAIFFDGEEAVAISDSEFVSNSGANGGSVAVNASQGFAMTRCKFEDSQSGGNGGAVSYTGPGEAVFSEITVTGALAGGSGGAIYVDSDNHLAITGSTFTDNAARYGGGAVSYYCDAETGGFTLRDVTLDGNGAFGGQGGAFTANGTGALVLENVKARGNFADGGGGAGVAYNFETGSIVGVRALDNVLSDGSGGASTCTSGEPRRSRTRPSRAIRPAMETAPGST
jgi:CSLREA domain-containing protein